MSSRTYSFILMESGAEAAQVKPFLVLNPATEETIGTVAHADKADLDAALAAAEKGFKVWRAVAPFERAKLMRKAAETLRERADSIATIMSMEQGKTFAEAKMETMAGADIIDWFAEEEARHGSVDSGPRAGRLSARGERTCSDL